LKAVNRDNVFKVQTPQCFFFNEIFSSYKIDYDEAFTDDASVFEARQGKIKNVMGSYNNIKITTTSGLRVSKFFN
jgi:2-C-methyl-D-erythritol 4-phosphate cytidylyltransferase